MQIFKSHYFLLSFCCVRTARNIRSKWNSTDLHVLGVDVHLDQCVSYKMSEATAIKVTVWVGVVLAIVYLREFQTPIMVKVLSVEVLVSTKDLYQRQGNIAMKWLVKFSYISCHLYRFLSNHTTVKELCWYRKIIWACLPCSWQFLQKWLCCWVACSSSGHRVYHGPHWEAEQTDVGRFYTKCYTPKGKSESFQPR